MDDIKINKNKTDIKDTGSQEIEKMDAALFDKTLIEIEKILEKLGEKIDTKQRLRVHEKMEEEKNDYNEEHTIDNTHLRMEELHNFSPESKPKNKSSFGFYTYLALVIGVIFATYEILNFSKNLIILKYPFSEPYLEYFYEVIEILAYIIMNIVNFIKNLF